MAQYDLNVIVCTDPRRCAGEDLVDELRQVVQNNGLVSQVQVDLQYQYLQVLLPILDISSAMINLYSHNLLVHSMEHQHHTILYCL